MITDLALSEEEKKNGAMPSVITDKPLYPYGLRINLDSKVVKKLNIVDAPKLGDKLMLLCKVEVVGMNMVQNSSSNDGFSLDLQITGMGMAEDHDATEDKRIESILYPEK